MNEDDDIESVDSVYDPRPTDINVCEDIDTLSVGETSIDELLNNYDKILSNTAKMRSKIENVLMQAVECTTINPHLEDIESVQKKIMVLESASRILDSREKSYGTRVAFRMKRQNDADMSAVLNAAAVGILQKIQAANVNYVDTTAEAVSADHLASIEAQLGNLNPISDIKDTEIVP